MTARAARYNDRRWGIRLGDAWLDPLTCLHATEEAATEHADAINRVILRSTGGARR